MSVLFTLGLEFPVHIAVHRNRNFTIKTNRPTNFQIYSGT